MVDFGGWELPQQYTSIRDEHLAVRKVAGLFDISHMGRVVVKGSGAAGFVQGLVTNDVSKLEPHRALYALMCREDGGVLDDLVIYKGADGPDETEGHLDGCGNHPVEPDMVVPDAPEGEGDDRR